MNNTETYLPHPPRRKGLRQDRFKGEEAEGFVGEGLSKLRAKMSSSGGKGFPPPNIPVTPSKAINDMLNAKCGRSFDNPIKYGVATFVCLVFSAVLKVYTLIYRDHERKPSHTMWMAACGIICLEHIVASYIVYHIVIGCSFLLHYILYYGIVLFCLFGVGLGISGMVFFDKDKNRVQSPGFESSKAD